MMKKMFNEFLEASDWLNHSKLTLLNLVTDHLKDDLRRSGIIFDVFILAMVKNILSI